MQKAETPVKTRRRVKWVGDLSLSKYKDIEASAAKRGLPFTCSQEEMWEAYTGVCALTLRQFSSFKEASIDRIDSLLGYVRGNIQWVFRDVNVAKGRLPQQDYVNWCHLIVRHADKGKADA